MNEREFEGTAYAREFEGERAVRILVGADGLSARTASDVTLVIRYVDCQIERGGANDGTWFCHVPDHSISLLCRAPGFIEAVRAQAEATLGPAIDRLQRRAHQGRQRGRVIWASVLAGVLALMVAGSLAIQTAAPAAVDALPTSIDTRMGELAWANMSTQDRALDDAQVQAALRAIVDRLRTGTSDAFTYRVHVIDAPITNAFALPGGILVVYTGLLRAAETPEQLAGVLAHEMSHVQRRHSMRRIAQSLGVVAAFQLFVGDVSGLAAVAVGVLQEGTVNSYSRQQEREADLDAVRSLSNAGIDPRALAGFFEVLQRQESDHASVPGWLATHPDLRERVAEIRAQARLTPVRESKSLAISWPDIQRRVRATESTKPPARGPARGGGQPFVSGAYGSHFEKTSTSTKQPRPDRRRLDLLSRDYPFERRCRRAISAH